MIVHLFMLRWKDEATQADKDRALRDVMGFRGKIPGLLEVKAGRTSRSGRGGMGLGQR